MESVYLMGMPLPVELSSFSVTLEISGDISVQWTTESELNNLGFNVLRSKKIDGDYIKINLSLINGNGNSSYRNQYKYTDNDVIPRIDYYYKLQDYSYDGQITTHGPITFNWEDNNLVYEKKNLKLHQNIPNPFNTLTKIRFFLAEPSDVKVTIYSNQGRKIKLLFNGPLQNGLNILTWDAGTLSSGLYFYTIVTAQAIVRGKMILIE